MQISEIIGNDEIKRTLMEQVNKQDIVHSYLFVGQEGIGKKLFARNFAKRVLCLNKNKEDDLCESCVKFNSNNHPDYREIKPDGNSIKISQIREMLEDVYQKPIVSERKIIIIDDADLMTEEAQNSLLKTLEEPPQFIVIILITSNESLLLNTIKSRCMKIQFQNLSDADILAYIQKQDWKISPSSSFIKLCNGSIGKVERYRDNLEQYQKVEQWIRKMKECLSPLPDVVNEAEFLYESKGEISSILEYLLILVNEELHPTMEQVNINHQLFQQIEIIQKTLMKLKTNANFDMCIDELIFQLYDTYKNNM